MLKVTLRYNQSHFSVYKVLNKITYSLREIILILNTYKKLTSTEIIYIKCTFMERWVTFV